MANFKGVTESSVVSSVLGLFPRNAELTLRLLDAVMAGDGALTMGEREAIAAHVSKLNTTPYCVVHHTNFSEALTGPIEATNSRLQPLLDYASAIVATSPEDVEAAFDAAQAAGWSEQAIWEVVEVAAMFGFINTVVKAARLPAPVDRSTTRTADEVAGLYAAMAEGAKAR